MNIFRKKLDQRGLTLPEAMMAMAVLAIGIVGLQSVIRRGLVSSVRAWDKNIKTSIAQSRLEEHKAQVYNQYLPGMVLPVIVPTPRANGTPGVDFKSNTITYTSTNEVSLDAVNNLISAQSGYSITFPTPGISPTYYYGNVNYANVAATPTGVPTQAWVSVNNRPMCDQTNGNIYFTVNTPGGINGTMALWFVDYGNAKRQAQVILGYPRITYDAGSISATPTAPTTYVFSVNSYDTASGAMTFQIAQGGTANDWGTLVEDGTANSSGLSLIAGNTPTQTYTPTPAPIVCTLNSGDTIYANDSNLTLSGMGTSGTGSSKVFYANSSGDRAIYSYTSGNGTDIQCPGYYIVNTSTKTGSGGSNNVKVTLLNSSGSNNPTPICTPPLSSGVTAVWYGNTSNTGNLTSQQVLNGTSYATSKPVTWIINTPGNYTLTFYAGTTNSNMQINNFSLQEVAFIPTPTYTAGPAYTPTFTPTAQPVFTFPDFPTPRAMANVGPAAPFYQGTPTSFQAFGCDVNNAWALTASGTADSSHLVKWASPQLTSQVDGSTVNGVVMETDGSLVVDVRAMAGMAVTFRAAVVNSAGAASTLTTNQSYGTSGWKELSLAASSGMTINNVYFEMSGASTSSTNYLAIDSIRTVYNQILNPNVVLTGASLSALDSYRDTTSFYPSYVVDSKVVPISSTANLKGYQVQVIVHNAKNGVISDTFAPITITNTVSP